jgi:hypothetical protein
MDRTGAMLLSGFSCDIAQPPGRTEYFGQKQEGETFLPSVAS